MSGVIRTPYLRVTCDGQEVTNRLSASWTLGYDLRIGEATIVVPFSPPWSKYYSYIVIEAGANQATSAVRWSGFIVEFDSTSYPGAVALICRGPLYFADLDQCDAAAGIDLSAAGAGQTDQAIVAFLLFEAGLAAYHGTLGGTGKTLGTLAKDQYLWPLGQSALAMIDAIDQISLGYRTFETTGGSIIRTQITANPGTTPAATFTDGVDILAESTNQQSVMSIKNAVAITGYNDPATGAQFSYNLQQANPYIINGVRVESLSSPLIESSTTGGTGVSCQEVAEWLLPEVNRGLDTLSLATPRDDNVGPGSTIAVNDLQRLGLNQNLWVQRVQGSFDASGFTQHFTCLGAALGTGGQGSTTGGVGGGGSITPPGGGGGSNGGSGGGSNPPTNTAPIADFTIQVEQEVIIVSGAEADLFVVSCVSAVTPGTGAIASYAWSTSGGSPHPTSGTDPDFATSYAAISTQTITLTVTDANGLTSVVTKPVPPSTTVQYVNRRLYLAGTTCIDDFDGTVWRTNATPSNLVANGPMWGHLTNFVVSPDDLQTAPVSVSPFSSGNVTALWFEGPASQLNIVAGSSNGAVAYSLDGGQAWTICNAAPSAGHALLRVIKSRYVAGQFFALTAGGLFRTDNWGNGWVTVVAAAGGETFRDVSVSFKRIMIAMAGGRLVCDAAGVAQTLAANSGNIVAITADIKADRFFAFDSVGATFRHTADGGATMGARAALPGTPIVGGAPILWRDEYIRGLLYLVTAGSAYKSVDGFGSTAGYFLLRTAGVGTAPGGASYDSIGANGIYTTRILPPTTIHTVAGVGNTFNAGNSGSGYTFPAGWQQPGFVASGWTATASNQGTEIGGGGAAIAGSTWLTYPAAVGVSVPGSQIFLLVYPFTLGTGTIHQGLFTFAVDADLIDLYVNGTWVGGNDMNSHYGSTNTFTLPGSVFRTGANVIAMKVRNGTNTMPNQGTMGVIWSLVVS